jgi:hypothetical protein
VKGRRPWQESWSLPLERMGVKVTALHRCLRPGHPEGRLKVSRKPCQGKCHVNTLLCVASYPGWGRVKLLMGQMTVESCVVGTRCHPEKMLTLWLIDWLIDWLICSLQVLYHLSNVSSLFGCRYFSNRVSCFCPGWPGPSSSYLCFPCSWDDRHTMPSFYKLRWGLWNFLQGLSYCLINFTDFLDWILVALGPSKLKGIFLYAVLFPKYFQSILLKVIIDSKNSYISHINPMSVFLF